MRGSAAAVTSGPCSPSAMSARTVRNISRLRRQRMGSSITGSSRASWESGDGAGGRGDGQVAERVEGEPLGGRRADDDVDQAVALAHLRRGGAGQQRLQRLRDDGGREAELRQAFLVEGDAHARRALAPGELDVARAGVARRAAATSSAVRRRVSASGPWMRNCTGKPTGGPNSRRETRMRASGTEPSCARARSLPSRRSRAARSAVWITTLAKDSFGRSGFSARKKRGAPAPR